MCNRSATKSCGTYRNCPLLGRSVLAGRGRAAAGPRCRVAPADHRVLPDAGDRPTAGVPTPLRLRDVGRGSADPSRGALGDAGPLAMIAIPCGNSGAWQGEHGRPQPHSSLGPTLILWGRSRASEQSQRIDPPRKFFNSGRRGTVLAAVTLTRVAQRPCPWPPAAAAAPGRARRCSRSARWSCDRGGS